MSDFRGRRDEEPPFAEIVDTAIRRIVTSVVIAGAVIGLAIYSRPSPPRYQVTAADGRVYRINSKSGTVVGCQGERCAIVLQRGQDLEDSLPEDVPKQVTPPVQALPAPPPSTAPAPTQTPATR